MDDGSTILVGDPAPFAIETGISQAYERLGYLGLGFFVIHIQRKSFGVREWNATTLACSYDEIRRRLAFRGHHRAWWSTHSNGQQLLQWIIDAHYTDNYGGLTEHQAKAIDNLAVQRHLFWAPDGDEAFDDSSYIVHFDIDEEVRLLGGKRPTSHLIDPDTFAEVRLSGHKFYAILAQWCKEFDKVRSSLPQISG